MRQQTDPNPAPATTDPVTIQRKPVGPKPFRWSARLVAQLGEVPDAVIAKRVGLSATTVRDERVRRGIAAYRARRSDVVWTERMIAMLGSASDRAVAQALGISYSSVGHKRRVLGIEACYPSPHDHPLSFRWTKKRRALLGTMTDRAVAKRFGIAPSAVTNKRNQLGIEARHPKAPRIVWTDEMIERLGKESDEAIGRRYGISSSSVGNQRSKLGIAFKPHPKASVVPTVELQELLERPSKEVRARTGLKWETITNLRAELGIVAASEAELKWTPELVAWLGKDTDEVIASKVGLSASRVTVIRRSMGIPAVRPRRKWTPDELAMLGTMPDRIVAERLGRSVNCISATRSYYGVPPYRRRD